MRGESPIEAIWSLILS